MKKQFCVVALGSVLAVGLGCESMGGGGSKDNNRGGAGSTSGAQSDSRSQADSGEKLASAKSGNPDALFMTETAHMSHAEIAASQLALNKATDPRVKKFAQQMIDDHTKGNQQLMALAKQKGVDLPKGPDQLHVKGAASMANMSGSDFDREYMSCMTSDHAKLLSSVEDKAATAKDSDVRAFASSQVPIIRHHYQMALDLNRSLGGAATGGGAGAAGSRMHNTGGAGSTGTGSTTGTDTDAGTRSRPADRRTK